jgi:hypothetical protein
MAMGMTRDTGINSIPIWQGTDDDIQLAQGGFSLATTGLALGSIIPAGTPVTFNESTRVATITGGAVLYANATNVATSYQVNKGSTLKIGDNFAATAGAGAYPITAIDISNAGYDVITVGTTLGVAFTAGQGFFASTATGGAAAAYSAINGLLYADTLANPSESVSVVIRGTVYARRIPFAYSAGLTAIVGLTRITFSQSK